MSDSPHRVRFFFWLNMEKADEENVADIIEKLKTARRYTAAIRDGLRLMWDLSQGKTDVLLELFPFVKQALGGDDAGGLKGEIEQLKALIKESRIEPIALPANGLQPIGGLKPLSMSKVIAPPNYDDEDFILPVSKAEGGGDDATRNFLASMAALQQ